MDYQYLKSRFKLHFSTELNRSPELKILLYEIFVYGSAYIVGGYLRDFINNNKSRDIDIIVDLDNKSLSRIIQRSNIKYSINNHNGIKLQCKNIEVDMWSIENNWAFKNELVKLNENDKLNSIARGCFYNYDSLVINLHTFNLNVQNYKNFLSSKKLKILLKSPIYKNLNPTTEANILRAFYLKKTKMIQYSPDTNKYLIDKIGQLKDNGFEPVEILEKTKDKYLKYKTVLTKKDIINSINELYIGTSYDNQTYLDL